MKSLLFIISHLLSVVKKNNNAFKSNSINALPHGDSIENEDNCQKYLLTLTLSSIGGEVFDKVLASWIEVE
ncbi:MAG TPA: hypothetical protein PLP35_08675 [Caldisericia bacterium]|nr:hypothetical protein [Caldisericia bacterium]